MQHWDLISIGHLSDNGFTFLFESSRVIISNVKVKLKGEEYFDECRMYYVGLDTLK